MLKLYNSLGKKLSSFVPAAEEVTLFTCGPSIYQRAHIGNFRTFLFEDVLVRYLAHLGYKVRRGMNFTDIEDKAIEEAKKEELTVRELTDRNIEEFITEMKLLKMRLPEYLPRASDYVAEAAAIVGELLALGVAYRHGGNVYYDPLKFPGFGKLYGLDMGTWPKKRRRFHKDTYPGVQWNLGDFILWHGCRPKEPFCWETGIGKGRPSWNVQDPAMVASRFQETLSIYCGGIDNLYRHHDYSIAILEAIRPYPMARYWLHCCHLLAGGRKMSKSRGNVVHLEELTHRGYSPAEIRFFLIDSHYREPLSFSEKAMAASAARLARLREMAAALRDRAGEPEEGKKPSAGAVLIEEAFDRAMDDDLDVRAAIDAVASRLESALAGGLPPGGAAALAGSLDRIDEVLKVLF